MLLLLLVGLVAQRNHHHAVSAFHFNFYFTRQQHAIRTSSSSTCSPPPLGRSFVMTTTYLADDATVNIGSAKKEPCLTPLKKEEALAELQKIKERLKKAEDKLNSTLLDFAVVDHNTAQRAAVPPPAATTKAAVESPRRIEKHALTMNSYLENLSSSVGGRDSSLPVTNYIPAAVAEVHLPVPTTTISDPMTTTTEIEPQTFSSTSSEEPEELNLEEDLPSVEFLEDEITTLKAQINQMREEMAAAKADILQSLASMKQQKKPKVEWQQKEPKDSWYFQKEDLE